MRLIYNIKIIIKLLLYIIKNRGIRFNQALINLGIVDIECDDYYTEPDIILKKIKLKGGETQ